MNYVSCKTENIFNLFWQWESIWEQTEKDRKKYYVSVTLLKLAGINKSLYRG